MNIDVFGRLFAMWLIRFLNHNGGRLQRGSIRTTAHEYPVIGDFHSGAISKGTILPQAVIGSFLPSASP